MVDMFELFRTYGVGASKEEENYLKVLANIMGEFLSYRKAHHLSQADLAKRLEISQAMVSKIETGSVNLSIKVLSKIAAKLDASLRISFEFSQDNAMQKPYENFKDVEMPELNLKKESLGAAA